MATALSIGLVGAYCLKKYFNGGVNIYKND